MKVSLFAAIALFMLVLPGLAQNIVDGTAAQKWESRKLTEAELAQLDAPLAQIVLPSRVSPLTPRLTTEVDALIKGWPWRPFHHQLGISGAESHFDHPAELFAVLSPAIPLLSDPAPLLAFLRARLAEVPPFAEDGWDRSVGQARERYRVPDGERVSGVRKARSAWGVYAFYEYLVHSGDTEALPRYWLAIRERMRPLLQTDYAFDPARMDYAKDEAQRLNGDLAGLYATIHLAKKANDAETAERARKKAAILLQWRLDLERINPRIVEKTDAATKSLHHFKLARYLHLPEPVANVLAQDGSAAKRLAEFRAARPTWWLAFGDRLMGGENYTVSPDFGRALFGGAALMERRPTAELQEWLDVPWCRADLYFIERITWAIRSER
jgi:hypothetical protein